MSYSHDFDLAARLAVLRAVGPVTLESSVAAIRALSEDSRLEPGYGILVDMRGAEYTPNLADAARVGRFQEDAEAFRPHPVAFVTASRALHAAATILAAMAGSRGLKVRAFETLEPATDWLAEIHPG